MNRFFRKTITLIIACIILVSTAGCSYKPNFAPADIGPEVTIIDTRRVIEIFPATVTVSTTGLLFYPGGLVDNHVYNELLAQFSLASGIKTVVVKMPANLAVFDINAGLNTISNYPEITNWVIAGHSLGGSMAASTVKNNPEIYSGLIFMDSYPADGGSLKDWSGAILSLFSSIEKISDPERMEKSLDLIPPATWLSEDSRIYPLEKTNYSVLHQINGGSHSYFGTYGPQDGDYPPAVPRENFHAEVVDYMLEFFTENSWR